MWQQMGVEAKAPALKRAWKYGVTCGVLGEPGDGAPKLSGCGAELVLTKKDYYKKSSSDGSSMSFWFMCPCCGTENPIPINELEVNAKVLEKTEWLLKRRESIVAELLLGKDLPDGCTDRAAKLLHKLKLEVPEAYASMTQSIDE